LNKNLKGQFLRPPLLTSYMPKTIIAEKTCYTCFWKTFS